MRSLLDYIPEYLKIVNTTIAPSEGPGIPNKNLTLGFSVDPDVNRVNIYITTKEGDHYSSQLYTRTDSFFEAISEVSTKNGRISGTCRLVFRNLGHYTELITFVSEQDTEELERYLYLSEKTSKNFSTLKLEKIKTGDLIIHQDYSSFGFICLGTQEIPTLGDLGTGLRQFEFLGQNRWSAQKNTLENLMKYKVFIRISGKITSQLLKKKLDPKDLGFYLYQDNSVSDIFLGNPDYPGNTFHFKVIGNILKTPEIKPEDLIKVVFTGSRSVDISKSPLWLLAILVSLIPKIHLNATQQEKDLLTPVLQNPRGISNILKGYIKLILDLWK